MTPFIDPFVGNVLSKTDAIYYIFSKILIYYVFITDCRFGRIKRWATITVIGEFYLIRAIQILVCMKMGKYRNTTGHHCLPEKESTGGEGLIHVWGG